MTRIQTDQNLCTVIRDVNVKKEVPIVIVTAMRIIAGHEVTISGSSNAQEQVCGSECRETHEQVVAKDYPLG